MRQIFVLFIIISLLFTSCTSAPLMTKREIKNSYGFMPKEKFNEKKLVFSEKLRSYTYDNIVLRNELGEKIRTKEEFEARIEHKLKSTKTVPSRLSQGIGAILSLPGVILMFPVFISFIPGGLFIGLGNKDSEDIYKNYSIALELFKKNQFRDSRKHLMSTIKIKKEIGFVLDIYYWIGKTYESEGNIVMAKKYYEKFISFSESLYPAFFEKYNKEYKNDLAELDKRFSEVENLLKQIKI